MITLLEIIRRSEDFLAERGVERPRQTAEEVIADALGMQRLDLYLQFDRPLATHELPLLREVIARSAHHEPSAYIRGYVTFAGVRLKVDNTVLIPRMETEILVEMIAQTLEKLPLEGKVLWDVCCGSGCIGIALKARFPQLTVILSDIREEALQTARLNACFGEIHFKKGDLFAPFGEERCDFFICNPPYVTESEFENLSPSVRNWEPRAALVAGETGLEYYARIAPLLRTHLNPQGRAWLEIGTTQGPPIQHLFSAHGYRPHILPDWSGHDRFCLII